MDTGPRFATYRWSGGEEPVLRIGPDDAPRAVIALPLFEEANRTRTFAVSIMRALAARGIQGALPELPGQGESTIPTDRATIADLRAAFAKAAAGAHVVAIRSGALLAGRGRRWLLAPQTGVELLRDLRRIAGGALDQAAPIVAGNKLSPVLRQELVAATHDVGGGPVRTVRLATDPQPADLQVEGSALWRRAEPGNNPALAAVLAGDIADWIAACAA